MPMLSAASVQRRVLRQRIRSVGGVVLLVAACLAAFATLVSSPSSSSLVASVGGASNHRQLTSASLHVNVRLHHHQTHALTKAAAATQAANSSSSGSADGTITEASTETDDSCGATAAWESNGGIFVYVFALLYIFVALAIVCDDYFVTALERITEKLGLSQDVAGATFMAAGSSAPELFVSLADNVFTKPEGSMGIGTIVGSAIFNILIIISLSALLAGQVLVLDWRPMLRDSLWYCWAIVVLIFVTWDGSVDVVESVVLFGSYIAYCIFMSQNEKVIRAFCRRPDDVDADAQALAHSKLEATAESAAQLVDAHVASSSASSYASDSERRAWTIDVERVEKSGPERITRQSSTGEPGVHTAGAGHHRPHPHRLGSQSKLNPMFRSKYRMFQNTHTQSHEQSMSRRSLSAASNSESDTSKASAAKHSVGGSLRPITAPTVAEAAVVAAATTAASLRQKESEHERDGAKGEDEEEEVLGGYFEEIYSMPKGWGALAWFFFTRPLVIPMRLTIPDCRYPMFSGTLGFTATFLMSIVWIAVLSHYTVEFATRFGCIAGIPSSLMGLTILAAGTSVPDALSSILVARDGHGDMAVSNALGSNVFDILLGLGFPFFLSNLVYGEAVTIATDDLEISIFILFGVLLTVVALLILSKWRLRRGVGFVMVTLYVVYVVFSYLRGLGWL